MERLFLLEPQAPAPAPITCPRALPATRLCMQAAPAAWFEHVGVDRATIRDEW